MISGPVHPDTCGHGPDAYLGSFEACGETWDAYAFGDPCSGAELCLRFGGEGPDYASAGSIANLIARREDPAREPLADHYAIAVELYEARSSQEGE